MWVPPSTRADQEVLVSHAPAYARREASAVPAGAWRPIAHVAAEARVSRQCRSTWYRRWLDDGEDGLLDRSSQPHGSPRRTSPELTARIERLRRDRKFGPARIAHELARQGRRIAASTVHRVLVRLGLSRLRDLDRPTGPAG